MTRAVFTICSANYLATAKILMDSLRVHEPDSRRVLVLVERSWPEERLAQLADLLQCEVLPAWTLALPDIERMAFQYDLTEFNTAVKPFVFQHLFAQAVDDVIYLDPDIKLYQPLSLLWTALASHGAVVTPHITEPLPDDGLSPSNENMARCGQYNFGFVGFARRSEAAARYIAWWAGRLTDHCIFHPQHYYFVDQFYGALVSSFVPDTHVVPHHGYNYAYWNAPQRTLSIDEHGQWQTGDGPLVFFHFSGFTSADPAALSRHQNRVRAEAGSGLARIAQDYAEEQAGNREACTDFLLPYTFGHYDDGTPIDTLERWAYRDLSDTEKRQLGAPFQAATRERLGRYAEVNDVNFSAAGLLWEVHQQGRQHADALAGRQAELDSAQHATQQLQQDIQHQRQHIAHLEGQVRAQQEHAAHLSTLVDALRGEQARTLSALQDEQKKYTDTALFLQRVEASPSFRLGRAITAPARAVRRATSLSGRLWRYVLQYRRQHGWANTLKACARFAAQGGLRQNLRRLFTQGALATPQAQAHLPAAQRARLPLTSHTERVDIVVCIHNAPGDVRQCLDSVLRHTEPPYRLILVDDGSGEETRDLVRAFSEAQGAILLRNEEAGGYTLAANQGLRASTGEFVVLLNSDTIVSPGWLDRMARCMRSDERIGVVGPLSNTASWQSVPQIFDERGDWYDNPLPDGVTVADMAAQVAELSACQYPRVGFLNGFCYMIRRATIEQIGIFDEDTFRRGFGEENDYSLRATQAGWDLAVADDAYVFHAQSRSYSSERRLKLAKLADEALNQKHGGARIGASLQRTRDNLALAAIRARMADCWTRRDQLRDALARHEGRRVLFLLPTTSAGGGGNVVIQEARAMTAMGVDARIVNLRSHQHWFEHHHPQLGLPVDYLDSPDDLDRLLPQADAVVATLYTTVGWIADSLARTGVTQCRPGYYIQDYEPFFFPPDDPEHDRAVRSYSLLPQLVRVTKTEWNRAEVLRHCEVDSTVVGCSYDTRLFVPMRPKHGQAPVRVIAMVRPSTPRRSPELTLQVLKGLHAQLGDSVQLRFFGVHPEDAKLAGMDTDFPHANLGELSPEGVAAALDDTDVFLDFSTYQAMGLTALEAMACGVAVVAPQKGGTGDILTHEENGLLVDTADAQACLDAALRLATDHALRQRLQQAALASAPRHSPEQAAARLLDALFD